MNPENAPRWLAPFWAIAYAGLAALSAISHWPRLLQWIFEPSVRVLTFRYYSPLIELTVLVYAVCAFGFWRGKRWAPWLACLWLIVSAASRSFLFLLPVGGAETSEPGVFVSLLDLFRQGPSAWPVAILFLIPRAALGALLLRPELWRLAPADAAGFSRAFGVADAIIIRLIAVIQFLAFLYLLLAAYGIGFYPPVLTFNVVGLTGACLLMLGKRAGRVVLLIWYGVLLAMLLVNGSRSQVFPREVAIVASAAMVCSAYLGLSLWLRRKMS